MKHDNHGIRKAAVLVSALDRKTADVLLDQMGSRQAARVRQAVVEQGPFDSKEQRRVVDEFFHGSPPPSIGEASIGKPAEQRESSAAKPRAEDTPPPADKRPADRAAKSRFTSSARPTPTSWSRFS